MVPLTPQFKLALYVAIPERCTTIAVQQLSHRRTGEVFF